MDIPQTFEEFKDYCCYQCNANDWYCPDLCVWMTKAQKYPIEKLQKAFIRYDGDVCMMARRIGAWK